MARKLLHGILNNLDGPIFQESIINPELIEESPSNYDSLNSEKNMLPQCACYYIGK